jgi:formate dehydrogenase beta subunit
LTSRRACCYDAGIGRPALSRIPPVPEIPQFVGHSAAIDSQRLTVEQCATCRAACPVHTDTRAYVDLITQGRYEEAFEKVREFNPFPGVCALVCHHPCEDACRRAAVDEPIALRHLKRFVVEQAAQYRRTKRQAAGRVRPQTIGIVGGGPAGLTAARDCAEAGYGVTVYEASNRLGGLLFWGVPRYRLPVDVLEEDVDDVLALGIEVRTGAALGRDLTLAELRERHDAVVLAMGLGRSRMLPLEGTDHPDVHGALDFLAKVAAGDPPAVGETVLVVGGGNVAVDVARTAIRLGARTVRMVCLESREEMPAWDWECREALEEGIEFVHRRGPVRVLIEGGRIAGLEVREAASAFDEAGRFAPRYVDANRSVLRGSTVAFAVGQEADLSVLGEAASLVANGGLLKEQQAPGVFACGEAVTGPGSAIEAVADGHRCARSVIGFLDGGLTAEGLPEVIDEVGDLTADVLARIPRLSRTPIAVLPSEDRRAGFAPFEFGYSESEALREAWRCMACTAGADVDESKCASCLACARICPFGVPVVDGGAVMQSEQCQSCGLCAVECPAVAISIERLSGLDLVARIARVVGGTDVPADRVEIVCGRDAESREALADAVVVVDGARVARFPVSCAALADEVAMMKPFEFGVRTVSVVACSDCSFEGAESRLARRVERVRGLLDETGIGGANLSLLLPQTAEEVGA